MGVVHGVLTYRKVNIHSLTNSVVDDTMAPSIKMCYEGTAPKIRVHGVGVLVRGDIIEVTPEQAEILSSVSGMTVVDSEPYITMKFEEE